MRRATGFVPRLLAVALPALIGCYSISTVHAQWPFGPPAGGNSAKQNSQAWGGGTSAKQNSARSSGGFGSSNNLYGGLQSQGFGGSAKSNTAQRSQGFNFAPPSGSNRSSGSAQNKSSSPSLWNFGNPPQSNRSSGGTASKGGSGMAKGKPQPSLKFNAPPSKSDKGALVLKSPQGPSLKVPLGKSGAELTIKKNPPDRSKLPSKKPGSDNLVVKSPTKPNIPPPKTSSGNLAVKGNKPPVKINLPPIKTDSVLTAKDSSISPKTGAPPKKSGAGAVAATNPTASAAGKIGLAVGGANILGGRPPKIETLGGGSRKPKPIAVGKKPLGDALARSHVDASSSLSKSLSKKKKELDDKIGKTSKTAASDGKKTAPMTAREAAARQAELLAQQRAAGKGSGKGAGSGTASSGNSTSGLGLLPGVGGQIGRIGGAVSGEAKRIADAANAAGQNAANKNQNRVVTTIGGNTLVYGNDSSLIPPNTPVYYQGEKRWVFVRDGVMYTWDRASGKAGVDAIGQVPITATTTAGGGTAGGQNDPGGGGFDPAAGGFVDPISTYQPKNVGEAILLGVASALQQAGADAGESMDFGGGDFGGGGGGYGGGGYADSAGYIVGDSGAGGGLSANPPAVQRQQVAATVVDLVKPRKNSLPNRVTVADRSVVRKIGAEIDKKLDQEIESLVEAFQPRGFTDDEREKLLADRITPEMDKVAVTEFKNALIDQEPDAVARSAKKLGLSNQAIAEPLARIKLNHSLKELKTLVIYEDSPEKVASFGRRIQTAIREFQLDRAEREMLGEAVESITETLQMRLAISAKSTAKAGATVASPQGEVPVVFYPPLAPAGKVFLLGDDVLAVGTAAKGPLVLGNGDANDLLNISNGNGDPVESITLEKAKAAPRDGTLVFNPPDSGAALSYSINGHAYSIEPGQSQHLPADTQWVISFDRGNGRQARYTLDQGTYQFSATDGAWDIGAKTFSVTLENPSLTGRFFVVIDNQPAVIPAGQALELTSAYPVVVGFDRGDGTEPAYKRLLDGTFTASLNTEENLWDLYASEETEEGQDESLAAAVSE